tara:strand:+ start:20933 stop:21451 length:519 start_codon:yes stop_codon:yes gene_type:complete
MLACKTPTSLKKGDLLYSFEGVSYDDGSSSVEAHEWIVRSIQTRPTWICLRGVSLLNYSRKAVFVNLVRKKKNITWVDGKWASYIPKDYKNKFERGERLPEGIYTTQLQAIKFAIERKHEGIAYAKAELDAVNSRKDIDIWAEELACYEKEMKLLKGRFTRIKNLKLKAKSA